MNEIDTVTFVTRQIQHRWSDIDRLDRPESIASRFRSGIDVWILQTYLQLREHCEREGFNVALNNRFAAGAPVVAHRDDLRAQTRYWCSYLAVTRADRGHVRLANWHVVQNPLQAGERSVLIPSWPQPGLIPRDALRQGIRTLGFFGRASSMPAFLRDCRFAAQLERRGIRFVFDESNWNDYSGIDLCVALRYDPAIGIGNKPFAKLTNCWLAGVPALLGPEPAYQAQRRSEYDYIEVNSAREILAAIDVLIAAPDRYRRMVANGLDRSVDFTVAAVRTKWIHFLAHQFLPAWQQARRASTIHRSWFRAGWELYWQSLEQRAYKRIEARQRAEIEQSGVSGRFDEV